MAENLGLAWKDLNAQLEQRRQILEQAVAFFTKSEQVRMNCFNGLFPTENFTKNYAEFHARILIFELF